MLYLKVAFEAACLQAHCSIKSVLDDIYIPPKISAAKRFCLNICWSYGILAWVHVYVGVGRCQVVGIFGAD